MAKKTPEDLKIDELTVMLMDTYVEHNSELMKTTHGNTTSKADPLTAQEVAEAFLYIRNTIANGELPEEDDDEEEDEKKEKKKKK